MTPTKRARDAISRAITEIEKLEPSDKLDNDYLSNTETHLRNALLMLRGREKYQREHRCSPAN